MFGGLKELTLLILPFFNNSYSISGMEKTELEAQKMEVVKVKRVAEERRKLSN